MNRHSKIYVAGHRGLVGSAVVRRLRAKGYCELLTRKHSELELEQHSEVQNFFAACLPEYVVLAAAKVGGIIANSSYPVDFLLRNLKIQTNVIEAAWRYGVKGLLFLGSSCSYPKLAPQPLKEEYLLSGPLEPTSEPYAVAKIAGIKLCESYNRQYGTRFLSIVPTTLYGPNDSYDLENSHVLPAFIRKFHLAQNAAAGNWDIVFRDEAAFGNIPTEFAGNLAAIAIAGGNAVPEAIRHKAGPVTANPALKLWGTGSPRREFLYSDDLADACILLLERLGELFEKACTPSTGPVQGLKAPAYPSSSNAEHLLNIGNGKDIAICELASKVSDIVGFTGPIEWDTSKPDGTHCKLLDISKINRIGWAPSVSLDDGIRMAYEDYRSVIGS
jgi:GDP-L-fucose synthase